MKLVLVSNFALETVAERLLEENLEETLANVLCEKWNEANCSDNSTYFCRVKPDDYVLWRGMADLVGDEGSDYD